jgi:ribosomal protein L15
MLPIAFTQAQSDTTLANRLAKLVIVDQQAAGLPPKGTDLSSPTWQAFKDSVFKAHYEVVKTIFETEGFPGYNTVGKTGSKHFWLLVQHLDQWPAFQAQVLQAMAQQVQKQNASAQDFAYLTDRVRLNTGKPQLYGTQVTYNTTSCQAMPKNLEASATVNERRKAVGLDRLETYLDQMSTMHFEMNRAGYEKRGVRQPKLYGDKPYVE